MSKVCLSHLYLSWFILKEQSASSYVCFKLVHSQQIKPNEISEEKNTIWTFCLIFKKLYVCMFKCTLYGDKETIAKNLDFSVTYELAQSLQQCYLVFAFCFLERGDNMWAVLDSERIAHEIYLQKIGLRIAGTLRQGIISEIRSAITQDMELCTNYLFRQNLGQF